MRMRKVVIPAAGLGTRFFPWSKAMPKELLPLGSCPAIEHVVREAVASGCDTILMIAGSRKSTIVDYFEKAEFPANFAYIPQPQPQGLGHAISLACPFISENEFFGVMLPDELFFSTQPGLQQLMDIALQEQACVVAVQPVARETVSSYGIIGIKKQLDLRLMEVESLVEKPSILDAPSNYALIGRYVLPAKIFQMLETTTPGARGEIQLTDAISKLLTNGQRVLAYHLQGTRYDIGTPLGWMQAVIKSSHQSPEFGGRIHEFMQQLVAEEQEQCFTPPPSRSIREFHDF